MESIKDYLRKIGAKGGRVKSTRKRLAVKANLLKANAARKRIKRAKLLSNAQ